MTVQSTAQRRTRRAKLIADRQQRRPQGSPARGRATLRLAKYGEPTGYPGNQRLDAEDRP